MTRAFTHTRKLFAWLILAAYVFLGSPAFAGVVTCIGADGHSGMEWSHRMTASFVADDTTEFLSTGHGPCVDISAEMPANKLGVSVAERGEVIVLLPSPVVTGVGKPVSHGAGHMTWPDWDHSDPRALFDFVESVRLLI